MTRIDVSTRAAVVHYLRSIHVNPKGAMVQRGLRNYAGARCPGKGWTCASTKHTVVQIARDGGKNRFVCRSNKCTVVQISGTAHGVYMSGRQAAAAPSKPGGGGGNSGVCIKTGSGATTGTGQSCTISQVSGAGPNTAGIYENTQKVSGLIQAAQYTALITQQSSGSNFNKACVTQIINLDGSTANINGKPVTVTLKAHQSVIINQDAVGSGTNTANQPTNSSGACISGPVIPQQSAGTTALTQSQTLTSSVNATGPITQNEDRNDYASAPIQNPIPLVTDSATIPCAPRQGDTSDTANLCLDVEQNQGSGNGVASGENKAVFWQENYLSAVAHTVSGKSINQIQGAQKDGQGGLLGTVNQDSSGPSNFVSNQNETQCEDALPTTVQIPNTTLCSTAVDGTPSGVPVIQNQYGPEGVGNASSNHDGRVHYYHVGKDPTTSSQTRGDTSDTYAINQTSKQNNDTNAIQNNHILGGLSTPGTGTITQNANIQNQNKGDVQTGGGDDFQSFINCDGTDPTHPKVSCTKTLSKPKITGHPDDPATYGTDATFTFTNSDSSAGFLCSLDGGTDTTCDSGTVTYTTGADGLSSGKHTFDVKTRDVDNGTPGPAAQQFIWWITPPDPTITSSPPDPDFLSSSSTFTFTDQDNTVQYQCFIDSQPAASCSSGVTYSGLTAGSHTFTVTAYGANDSTFSHPDTTPPTVSWTILPLEVDALGGDGSSADWSCQPGGPIGLTVGTDPETYAQVALDDAIGVMITGGLSEPTFTTDDYAAGSPRWDIFLSNGDFLFGYPPNSGLNGSNFGWTIYDSNSNTDGLFHPWSDVLIAESGATVTEAEVIADGDQSATTTDNIGNLQFNGTTYNSGTCS